MSPMLCECCGKNPATIHYTEIKSDQRTELHICEACANERGFQASTPDLGAFLQAPIKETQLLESQKCPLCGLTFQEFRTKGRLGCPNDYLVFKEALEPLLDKIHQAHNHKGRLPHGQKSEVRELTDDLLHLRHVLKEAVRKEDYEEAARARDQIQQSEKHLAVLRAERARRGS